jgi:membrane-bound ClpP family serine protease
MAFIFLILGLFLIFAEFYVPGAILGTIGGILILASVFFFASSTSSVWLVIAYIIGVSISIVLLIKFAIWRIMRSKADGSIYSDDSQVGFKASTVDRSAIGKTGVVLSDLKPGGYILIEGKQQPAISLSGYLIKGSSIIVVDAQEENLIVQATNKEEAP